MCLGNVTTQLAALAAVPSKSVPKYQKGSVPKTEPDFREEEGEKSAGGETSDVTSDDDDLDWEKERESSGDGQEDNEGDSDDPFESKDEPTEECKDSEEKGVKLAESSKLKQESHLTGQTLKGSVSATNKLSRKRESDTKKGKSSVSSPANQKKSLLGRIKERMKGSQHGKKTTYNNSPIIIFSSYKPSSETQGNAYFAHSFKGSIAHT